MKNKSASGDKEQWVKSWLAIGTVVRIHVVTAEGGKVVDQALEHAMLAVRSVEDACSRFDQDSELWRLMRAQVGTAVPVSPILFQSLRFSVEVAEWTDGRFDPTVGSRLEQLGFTRHYLTGESIQLETEVAPDATFADIELDETNQTVRLHKPMRLDLGAVAKGLAVDLAVRELSAFNFGGFVVDAGGDVYAAGLDGSDAPWSIGIRHPILRNETIMTLTGTNIAVCTSGTYERRSVVEEGAHHILNAQTQRSAQGIISGTAVGPFAMMADALSTAAFLYPPQEALSFLENVGLQGVVITDDLTCATTPGMEGYLK